MSPLLLEVTGWVLFLVGLFLSLTGLPGPLLAVISLLIWWGFGLWAWFGTVELTILIVLLLLAETAEQAGGLVGLKWSGIRPLGWKLALAGGAIGLLVSVFMLNPVFIIVGLIGGAWLGEYVESGDPTEALRVALGFALGKFGGYLVKNAITVGVFFYVAVLRLWDFI